MKRIESENLLYPTFLQVVKEIQKEFREQTGHRVVIHETYRLAERQQWLYEQGRTRKGPKITNTLASAHFLGLSCDFVGDTDPYRTGIQGPYDIDWKKLGSIVLSKGLVWGGNFKSRDMVHVEMRGPYTTKQLFDMTKDHGILYVWHKLEGYYGKKTTI